MDELYQQIITIVATILSGIDLTALAFIIGWTIKQAVKHKKEAAITKETIKESFREVILPKNIKLDVSSKIEQPIKLGLTEIQLYLRDEMIRIQRGEQLILSILSQFSHINKLPQELQKEIADYLEANTVDEVKLD